MTAAGSVVVGVDSSTQSCKVEARELSTGKVVATGHAAHPPTQPPSSEQRPDAWWDALVDAIGQLPSSVRSRVTAIGVGGQQHGLVVVDTSGETIRPAKLWNDTTSADESVSMIDKIGGHRWAELVGSVPVPAFTITKLAWMARHEPDSLERAARLMLPHDYLTWRLTDEHVTDRGDASGSGWFDAASGEYSSDAFAAAGLDADRWLTCLPRVLAPTEAAGLIATDASEVLGLPADVVVGPGTGDNMAAALGLGLLPGDVVVSLGTSGTAYARSPLPTRDPSGAVAGFASASGDYLPLVCTLNATKVTDTVARWLGADAAGLSDLALAAVDDAGTAMLVPYFDGERTPNLPDATGSLLGVTNETTREQLALAAHDGVLCGLLDGVDALAAVGAVVDGRRFLVGGGSRSAAYRQRLADLSGQPVTIPNVDEAVAAGAAVQAAAVASAGSLDEIAERWGFGEGETVEPARDATNRRERYSSIIA